LISGCLTIAGAATDFNRGGLEGVGESQVTLLLGLSFLSIIIFGVLTVFKLHHSLILNIFLAPVLEVNFFVLLLLLYIFINIIYSIPKSE
jgi:hypothetical protein